MPPTLRLGGAYVSAAYRHLGVTRFEHHRDLAGYDEEGCERGIILGFGAWRGLMLDRLPVLGKPAPHALDQRNRIRSEFRRRHLTEPVLERARHVDLLPVAPYRGLPVHQPTERRFGVGRIMLGVGNVNGLACPGGHEYLHGGIAVAAGAAIEGFSNVRVRLDFPARNGLTKFGVAEFPGIERFAADAEKVGELLVGQSEKAHPIRALDKLRSISTRTPNTARGAVWPASAGLFRTGFRLGDVHQRTGNKRGFHCVLHHSLLHGAFHSTWNGRVLKNFRSADTRDAGLAAQAVEGGQNRRQIIPLIEAEIAKREDKRTDDGGRDLDNKSHRRVRRQAVARTCTGWGAPFLAPAKRARL